jgi:hypothetical protein
MTSVATADHNIHVDGDIQTGLNREICTITLSPPW